MAHSFDWCIEKRVIYLRFSGELIMDELKEVPIAVAEYVESGQAPVHSITDMLDVEKYPTSLQQFRNALQFKQSPKTGFSVVLVENRLMAFFSTVVNQLAGIDARGFTSWDGCIEFLKMRDPTLPELPKTRPER